MELFEVNTLFNCLTRAYKVWTGPLADGSQAVVLFNRGDSGFPVDP
jgi:hypothetical protein